MKMKKKEKPSENLDNYCSRPVKAEPPKVGGGGTTTNAWTLVMLFTSTRVRVSKF